ncbi:MAG: T9SS type A sorting domain-containing protein [Bacteroidetes bacterium]|nr:T9SS type A sorting domain-containing protein [Bacteroidota bacterium]
MRFRWILWVLCFFCIPVFSGAQTNISGVVNSYYQVVEVIPVKACIRVSNITGLLPNKRVLLVQMKGASFLTTNSTAFGDTTSTNEAGFYEAGTICAINGDSVFLFHNLLHSYTPSIGKVQLVAFAEYTSANVTDTLKATAWNNGTGTGGVIALFADLDITLNAPIYADAAGFNGGSVVVSNTTCFNAPLAATNYAYAGANTAPQNGAYKGDGIADIAASQNGGRGPLINGGGGGNNHNNSGGGGANLSAGGAGGGNSSTAGCTTTLKGLGGKPLKNWGGEKIFLGGGGGAGHNNNGVQLKGGGNGGGIVFIWANSITGNNYVISANGGAGGNSQSDGAGGGGAGGTIILAVNTYNGGVTVEANGGKGGDSDDGGNIGRCFGGGGGGSGGAVYFTGALPPVTVTTNGGAAGIETGRDPGCAAIQAATAGTTGAIITNYTFSRSTANAGYCALLLPSKLIAFNCLPYQDQVLLKWEILNPELVAYFTVEKSENGTDWQRLFDLTAVNNQEAYSSMDRTAIAGKTYYRLRITEKSGYIYYSPVRQLLISSAEQGFSIWPNPASRLLRLSRNTIGSAIVKIADGNGKLVYHTTVVGRLTELTLPVLAPGIYFIQVNGSVQKLLIR